MIRWCDIIFASIILIYNCLVSSIKIFILQCILNNDLSIDQSLSYLITPYLILWFVFIAYHYYFTTKSILKLHVFFVHTYLIQNVIIVFPMH